MLRGPSKILRVSANLSITKFQQRHHSKVVKPNTLLLQDNPYLNKQYEKPKIVTRGNIPKIESTSDDSTTELDDMRIPREFKELHLEDYQELYRDDTAMKANIQTVLDEYEFLKYNTMGQMPSDITVKDMEIISREASTSSERARYMTFLFKREMTKLNASRKKKLSQVAKREARETIPESSHRTGLLDENGRIVYGLWHNSLFLRLTESKMKLGSSNSRLRDAALFGKKLILDFDFESMMNHHHLGNSIEQVQASYGLNRYNYRDSFDLWFCNFQAGSATAKFTSRSIVGYDNPEKMITIKPDCFTNYFDKSRLVYLSPDASIPLTEDIACNDDIYIIGVYNDRSKSLPLTARKADKLGIKSRRLPLDQYVAWHQGSKSLCVNHVAGILLEVLNNGGNWSEAIIKHTPSRKIKTADILASEESKRDIKRYVKLKKFNTRSLEW